MRRVVLAVPVLLVLAFSGPALVDRYGRLAVGALGLVVGLNIALMLRQSRFWPIQPGWTGIYMWRREWSLDPIFGHEDWVLGGWHARCLARARSRNHRVAAVCRNGHPVAAFYNGAETELADSFDGIRLNGERDQWPGAATPNCQT